MAETQPPGRTFPKSNDINALPTAKLDSAGQSLDALRGGKERVGGGVYGQCALAPGLDSYETPTRSDYRPLAARRLFGQLHNHRIKRVVPFRYKEFYDVPRVIVLRYEGKLVLLYCAFDDRLDEYPDNYSVYVLPEALEPSLENESWLFLEDAKQVLLGQIPVKAVKFDSTRLAQLDPSVLDEVLCEA